MTDANACGGPEGGIAKCVPHVHDNFAPVATYGLPS
jgi:hypothetical protein